MKKGFIILAISILQIGFSIQLSLAQAPPPSGSPPSSFVGAPIDDYAWVLALGMLLYGVYFLRQRKVEFA